MKYSMQKFIYKKGNTSSTKNLLTKLKSLNKLFLQTTYVKVCIDYSKAFK